MNSSSICSVGLLILRHSNSKVSRWVEAWSHQHHGTAVRSGKWGPKDLHVLYLDVAPDRHTCLLLAQAEMLLLYSQALPSTALTAAGRWHDTNARHTSISISDSTSVHSDEELETREGSGDIMAAGTVPFECVQRLEWRLHGRFVHLTVASEAIICTSHTTLER